MLLGGRRGNSFPVVGIPFSLLLVRLCWTERAG